MWETWVRFLGQEDPLEKKMATHSSILAWRIPWTEKPGWLPVFLPEESHGQRSLAGFQYSCLENPMDREAWRATVHGVTRVGHDLATKLPPLRHCSLCVAGT